MADFGVTEVFTDVVNAAPAIEDDSFSVLFAENDVPQASDSKGAVVQSDDIFEALQGSRPR